MKQCRLRVSEDTVLATVLRFRKEGNYMIYLLTAIELSLGGSTHLHTNNTQNNTNNNECGRVRAVPRLCDFYPGVCLTTEEKARETSVRVRKTSVRLRKTSVIVQYRYYQKTPTHDGTSNVRSATFRSFDCFRNIEVWSECRRWNVRYMQLC